MGSFPRRAEGAGLAAHQHRRNKTGQGLECQGFLAEGPRGLALRSSLGKGEGVTRDEGPEERDATKARG